MDDAKDLGHNAGMDAYAYSPLMHPSAFRLLRLAAGSGHDEISCMLEQRIPEDAGDYEALSYTWGDPTEKRPIKCCNKPFLVTENLFSALRHLRYADCGRVLWIDAICINQESIPERNQQVGVMGDIYKLAREVTIWLGEDEQGNDAVDVVDRILQELSMIDREEWINQYSVPNCDDSLGDPQIWRSLEWLFGLPSFRRVWVVQEAALASSAIFMLGQQTLPWKNLGFAVVAIARRAFRGWAGMKESLLGFDMFILMDNYRERLVQGVEIDAVDAVWLTTQCGATEPRDKVFALGGIIRNSNTLDAFHADYNASYEEVLRNVATACLLKQKSLTILSFVMTPAKATQRGLPSWVLLWEF